MGRKCGIPFVQSSVASEKTLRSTWPTATGDAGAGRVTLGLSGGPVGPLHGAWLGIANGVGGGVGPPPTAAGVGSGVGSGVGTASDGVALRVGGGVMDAVAVAEGVRGAHAPECVAGTDSGSAATVCASLYSAPSSVTHRKSVDMPAVDAVPGATTAGRGSPGDARRSCVWLSHVAYAVSANAGSPTWTKASAAAPADVMSVSDTERFPTAEAMAPPKPTKIAVFGAATFDVAAEKTSQESATSTPAAGFKRRFSATQPAAVARSVDWNT